MVSSSIVSTKENMCATRVLASHSTFLTLGRNDIMLLNAIQILEFNPTSTPFPSVFPDLLIKIDNVVVLTWILLLKNVLLTFTLCLVVSGPRIFRQNNSTLQHLWFLF